MKGLLMSDDIKNTCKQCLLRDMAGNDDVLAQVEKMRTLMGTDEKVSDTVYEKRLDVCRECENLLNATCLKCGCYVEIRALSKASKCPGKRW